MSYSNLQSNLKRLDALLARLGVNIPEKSEFRSERLLVVEFLSNLSMFELRKIAAIGFRSHRCWNRAWHRGFRSVLEVKSVSET